jgi:hypothetical protein
VPRTRLRARRSSSTARPALVPVLSVPQARIGREFAGDLGDSGVWARCVAKKPRTSASQTVKRGSPGAVRSAVREGAQAVEVSRLVGHPPGALRFPEASGQTVHDPVLGLVCVACA